MISMMHVDMSRNKCFSNFLLQVASAAFPRMESSVMVDLSEFGLLVGYLSWVTVYKVNWSKDWMIGWNQVAHAGQNMRRALLCVFAFHVHTYLRDFGTFLHFHKYSVYMYVSWPFFQKLSWKKPHQHFGSWKRKILTPSYNILTCSEYPETNIAHESNTPSHKETSIPNINFQV